MNNTCLIEVAHKPGIKDPLADEISEGFKHLGVRRHGKVSTSKLYRLMGPLTPEERLRLGAELLSDPIVEEFYEEEGLPVKTKSVVVDVWYKPGVTDVVGESVLKALRDMDLGGVQEVRTGMRYRFWDARDSKTVKRLVQAVLIKPLIHDCFIH